MQTLEYATTPDILRQTIERQREWIEAKLGVPLSEAVFFETSLDLARIALDNLLNPSSENESKPKAIRRLRPLVASAETPPDFPPLISMRSQFRSPSLAPQLRGGSTEHGSSAKFGWQDCPVAIKLRDRDTPFIAWNIYYHDGPHSMEECVANMILTRRERADQVSNLIERLGKRDTNPQMHVLQGSSRPVAKCEWEQMVLDPQVVSLLKHDFEFFFEHKDWFREMELPHRRGYLLHGPPGNGKSTAIKCMMTSRGLSAYTMRLFDENMTDQHLDGLFQRALKNCPSLVVLEDLDRAFPKTGQSKSHISLQQLLNTLDGIASGEGIVVVATANEPTILDPAILRRPGRFDRVVHFPNPSCDLRESYFRSRKTALAPAEIERVAQASNGLSFAQLREAYIIAGQQAFERQDTVHQADLLTGIRALRQTMLDGSRHNHAAGFQADGTKELIA
jgi:ATPase family associated with various cellular activities (AAA)